MKLTHTILCAMALTLGTAGCATTGIHDDRARGNEYLKLTGSRIPQPADRMGRIPATAYPLYVMSRREIDRTGASDTAGALDYLPFVEIIR